MPDASRPTAPAPTAPAPTNAAPTNADPATAAPADADPATGGARASRLFYQSRLRRPTLDRALGVHVWDTEGRRYIDGSSGAMVSNIGHSNPRVLDAMRRQMERATFGYRLHFETEPAERLADRLAELAPEGMDRAFFVSGGSEAVESAVKLARQAALARGETGRWKVISRTPSYHGATLGALALTGYAPLTEPFAPMLRAMPKIPAPRAYLDGLDPADPATGAHYARMLDDAIEREGPDTVLAFVQEPIGGASTGALVPPAGYMRAVREICDRRGVILIHDEVMCGGGRTGRFFAAEHWDDEQGAQGRGCAPDLIAISKGFGAGYAPLGAVLARGEMVEAVLDDGGFRHGFTYAGNPLACAAGLAVLDEIARAGLIDNAARMGALLKSRLRALMDERPYIGDVRGEGLLLAFELVAERDGMIPLPAALNAHERVVEAAYAEGLVVYSRRTRGGIEGDHVLVCPPMIVTERDIERIMDKLTRALDAFARDAGLDR